MSATSVDRIEMHVKVDAPQPGAVELLQQSTGLSKQRIKHAMLQGAVWLTRGRNTRRLRRAKRTLLAGDEIHLYYDAAILGESPPEALLVSDQGGYSVWHKPTGMRSQGSKWGDHCTVQRWAERHLQPERSAFTVHRLDRAASGLILLAHSKRTAATLSALFRERQVEKRYTALVAGDFSQFPEPHHVREPLDGKTAVSEFSLRAAATDGTRSLLDVNIETGRKHQIRRHLAGLGFPILGDRLYGDGERDGVDLQLAAVKLAFSCPLSDVRVEYRLPGDVPVPTLQVLVD